MRWIRNSWVRLTREPTYAAIFVITLALGVGANAALFSALRGYFLAPLPFPQAHRLIVVQQSIGGAQAMSVATYDYLLRNAQGISAGGLVRDSGGILAIGNGQPHKVRLGVVTTSWFKTLGVAPFLGRTFGPEAGKPGGPSVAVLSFRFWQDAMHGDPDVVGKTVNINATPHIVIGVMPPGFHFASREVKFWVPQVIHPSELTPDQALSLRNRRFVARLRPGVNLGVATQELNALAQRQLKMSADMQNEARGQHYHIVTSSLRASLMGRIGTRLLLIELGAGLLLLLTVAILANLVTVRTLARRHEAALRIALGAGRWQLWRAALAETLPLGVGGGVLAMVLAWWGTALIARYGVGAAGTAFRITPDVWVVLFSLVLGCVIGAVAALPASFTPRKHLLARLGAGGRGGVGRRARLAQRGLSVAQIAIGVALMINAALLGVAFESASSHPIGVNTSHLYLADLGFHGPKFRDQQAQLAFYQEFGAAVRALPDVERAGVASELPFAGGLDAYGVNAVGGLSARSIQAVIEFVDGHALAALGTPIVHGRLIDAKDVGAKAPVAVIDTGLAQKLFGTAAAVGREITNEGQSYRVIGVIRPLGWMAQPTTASGTTPLPYSGSMLLPYTLAPTNPDFAAGPTMDLAVRSVLPLSIVKRELDGLLQKLAPDQAFSFVESMQVLKQRAYHGDQAMPVLFGLFSLLALVLAAVGTYGTVAYLIRLRMGEFAVRQVLGATPARVGRLALMQGASLAVLGILLGVLGGFLLTQALADMLAGVGSATAFAYIVAVLVMALAALGATAIPALRAQRPDLVSLLRPQ